MLPLTPLTLHLQQLDDLRLPDHAGSMLRGAFGMALRKLACITKQKDCAACPLYRSCPYTQIFETPPAVSDNPLARQTVNPYVIQPPAMGSRLVEAGEGWKFGFTLIGKAADQLPLVVYAWQQACEGGFGKTQSRAALTAITQGDRTVYTPDSPLEAESITPVPLTLTDTATLHFHSPLRLQQKGQVILWHEQVTADLLLLALARRVQRLLDLHTSDRPQLNFNRLKPAAQAIRADVSALRREDVVRYSSRQRQVVELDGLKGDITLHGDLSDFAGLLAVGEYVHVGKNATHGLGRYQIRNMTPLPADTANQPPTS
jgi:hypothetical protein